MFCAVHHQLERSAGHFFCAKKKEELKEKVYYLLQLRTMAPSYYPDTTKWRMERRCCLLNIIGAHSLDSILLPSDLRLRLFCLILRPLCCPMPALAFACYAAVLYYTYHTGKLSSKQPESLLRFHNGLKPILKAQ